jgi:hypothetical protein
MAIFFFAYTLTSVAPSSALAAFSQSVFVYLLYQVATQRMAQSHFPVINLFCSRETVDVTPTVVVFGFVGNQFVDSALCRQVPACALQAGATGSR